MKLVTKSDKYNFITFRFRKDEFAKLDFLSKKNKLTKTEIIRQLINYQYNEETNNNESEE